MGTYGKKIIGTHRQKIKMRNVDEPTQSGRCSFLASVASVSALVAFDALLPAWARGA